MLNIDRGKTFFFIVLNLILITAFGYICLISFSVIERPVFSESSGFFNDGFDLEIECERFSKVYYTLDGSNPVDHGVIYTGPIHIDSRLNTEGSILNDVKITTMGEEQIQNGFWRYLMWPVDKAVVVRAAAILPDGRYSDVVTETYFVGESWLCKGDDGYGDLPIMNLTINPDDLFDYEKGIYCLGKEYDESLERGEWEASANYMLTGKEWERPVSIAYFEDGKCVWNQDAGVRIKGGQTRHYPQKSFKLYQRKEYDGKRQFDYLPLEPYGSESIALHSGANDIYNKNKDAFINDLCSNLDYATMKSMPCYLFLNGEFWGVYWLMEEYNESYIEEHFGVDKEVVDITKPGGFDVGDDIDLSDEDEYAKFCEQVDIESYIQYYATMIYIARWGDWPKINEAYWKTNRVSSRSFEDGKARWMMFDLNAYCMENKMIDYNSFETLEEKDKLFAKLSTNYSFREKMMETITDISNDVFGQDEVENEIDTVVRQLRVPINKNYLRWFGTPDGSGNFDESINAIRSFFNDRKQYVYKYMYEWDEKYKD